MANPSRGEIDLDLDGTKYVLAATFNQACELEEMLHTSIFGIVQSMTEAKGMTINTISAVIYQGILGGFDKHEKPLDTAPTFNEVKQLVFKIGALSLADPVTNLLQLWIMTAEQSKEAEEVAKKD